MTQSAACDLCGSSRHRVLVAPSRSRALRSDRVVVDRPLRKIACLQCGLVREAEPELIGADYYRDEYALDQGDHVFHSADGGVQRSEVFVDWVANAAEAVRMPIESGRLLEVGASRGHFLEAVQRRWPAAVCHGLELNAAAAAESRRRGLSMIDGDIDGVPESSYDIVCAIAVFEHVPAPTQFLASVRRILKPGGHAVLIQPTQDVPSYDVLFVDHLFHFATAHVSAFAGKCGFEQLWQQVGFRFMPNFSAHVLQASGELSATVWKGGPAATASEDSVGSVMADMAALDAATDELRRDGRPFGVFGLHEVFALARAYSRIDEAGIAVGLDDHPENPEHRRLPFPVVRPESCAAIGVRDVFLMMNRVHYAYATERLAGLGIRAVPVLR